ncbi:MAG TPA: hypothetical protein VKQ30_23275 [Ktedonobacterales bacterium]|nr:hypothetical protein [Ktedonobacterales bacterium]
MYLITGIKREMEALAPLGTALKLGPLVSLEAIVTVLGGTRAAQRTLGNNPRTEQPYALRDIQRYLDFERRGKLPSNRRISPDAREKLRNAAFAKALGADVERLRQRGLRLKTTAEIFDPSGKPAGERTINALLSGVWLDAFLRAWAKQEITGDGQDRADMADLFNAAVMDAPSGYNFPGASIDAGANGVPTNDFSLREA